MSTNGNRAMGKVMVGATFRNNQDRVLAETGHLQADQVRRVSALSIVDSGAAMMVIPQELADRLGLPEVGEMTVRYADSRTAARKVVGQLEVEILGRRSIYRAVVEPNRKDPLIGVIVLEDLDFLIDPRNQTIVPRDPAGEIQEIE